MWLPGDDPPPCLQQVHRATYGPEHAQKGKCLPICETSLWKLMKRTVENANYGLVAARIQCNPQLCQVQTRVGFLGKITRQFVLAVYHAPESTGHSADPTLSPYR